MPRRPRWRPRSPGRSAARTGDDDEIARLRGEQLGGDPPEPLARAGDQRDLPVQPAHGSRPTLLCVSVYVSSVSPRRPSCDGDPAPHCLSGARPPAGRPAAQAGETSISDALTAAQAGHPHQAEVGQGPGGDVGEAAGPRAAPGGVAAVLDADDAPLDHIAGRALGTVAVRAHRARRHHGEGRADGGGAGTTRGRRRRDQAVAVAPAPATEFRPDAGGVRGAGPAAELVGVPTWATAPSSTTTSRSASTRPRPGRGSRAGGRRQAESRWRRRSARTGPGLGVERRAARRAGAPGAGREGRAGRPAGLGRPTGPLAVAGPVSQADPLEPVPCLGAGRRRAHALAPQAEGHVVEHAQVREEAPVLEDHADGPLLGGRSSPARESSRTPPSTRTWPSAATSPAIAARTCSCRRRSGPDDDELAGVGSGATSKSEAGSLDHHGGVRCLHHRATPSFWLPISGALAPKSGASSARISPARRSGPAHRRSSSGAGLPVASQRSRRATSTASEMATMTRLRAMAAPRSLCG